MTKTKTKKETLYACIRECFYLGHHFHPGNALPQGKQPNKHFKAFDAKAPVVEKPENDILGSKRFRVRNINIVKSVLSGGVCSKVARNNNVSVERVRQLVGRFCRISSPITFAKMPKAKTIRIAWVHDNSTDFLRELKTYEEQNGLSVRG